MSKLKVTFRVPVNTSQEEILGQVSAVMATIVNGVEAASGYAHSIEESGLVAVFAQNAQNAQDWQVIFAAQLKGNQDDCIKKVVQKSSKLWLKSGVILQIVDMCPSCKAEALVRIDNWHEMCECCSLAFEGRHVTEDAAGEQSADEQSR